MNKFDVAHIRQQGQDIIIIPLDRAFGNRSDREQSEIYYALEMAVRTAGLRGRVVAVWNVGSGRMAFRAPQEWSRFCQSLSWPFVARNINRTVTLH